MHGECESVVNEGRSLAAASSTSHAKDIGKRVERVTYKWSHLQQTILLRSVDVLALIAALL